MLKPQSLEDWSFRNPYPCSLLTVSFSIYTPHVPTRVGDRSLTNSRIHLSNMIGDDFSVNKTEIIIAARQGF